jgi:hypothetical protein
MNEQDLRDCFAMLRGITGASPRQCYEFADQMLEARKKIEETVEDEELGIAAVKSKRSIKRTS